MPITIHQKFLAANVSFCGEHALLESELRRQRYPQDGVDSYSVGGLSRTLITQ